MTKIMAGCAAAAVALALLSGCSGDDSPAEPAPRASASSTATTAPAVETTVRMGTVTGRLDRAGRRKARDQVAAAVDRWWDAAYVAGEYPRSDFADAFPGFTKGAARLARRQSATMSNAKVGDRVDTVEAVKRTVTVDVLAPGRKPAGATARVTLVLELSGDVERTDRVRGRVLLTPARTRSGWRVFGFDVRRDKVRSGT